MAEELGKITKPEAESVREKRKVYLVPLLFTTADAPDEYTEKLDLYWSQVSDHVAKLEATAGQVKRIYHESICYAGEEGLKVLEKMAPNSFEMTKEKCQQGATLEAVDDKELADELIDWERFIMVGFVSRKVANIVSDHYSEALKKRYECMASMIDETLQDGEASVFFIREGHSVQFPSGIEVFSVSPPALNDIHRWFRDRSSGQMDKETHEQES